MSDARGERFRRGVGCHDERLAERVALVGDVRYDEGCRPWQRAVRHHPAAVVRAESTSDVVAVVRVAADLGIPVTVMTTGHGSVAACDDGVLLNVAALREVELDRRSGRVRTGAGAEWADVLAAAAGSGLATLCGTVASIGVAGYSLQGGLGWMARSHGLAAGSLVEAEMVTSSGETVVASRSQHPELWWALRGGDGSFGVVTGLTFDNYPTGGVLGGRAYCPIERAGDMLDGFRRWSVDQPEWSNASVMLVKIPDLPQLPASLRRRREVALRAFAVGPEEGARQLIGDLVAVGGSPTVDDFSYGTFQGMIGRQGPPPPPVACHERIDLFDRLDGGVIDAMLAAAGPDSGDTVTCVELRQWGAALSRDSGDQAGAHPSTRYSLVTAARYEPQWPPGEVDGAIASVRSAIAPHTNGETLLNLYPDPTATATAFSADAFVRLCAVKAVWDPKDLIRPGHRIPIDPGSTP